MNDINGKEILPGARIRWWNAIRTDQREGTVREVNTWSGSLGRREWLTADNGAPDNWSDSNGFSLRVCGVSGDRVEVITSPEVETRPSVPQTIAKERAALAAWLRSGPEKIVECSGHRHKEGRKCVVISEMTLEDMADAVERGDFPGAVKL